ncbi:MAG: hypothetical protein Q9157_002372 [Trypethelium eluteriae]
MILGPRLRRPATREFGGICAQCLRKLSDVSLQPRRSFSNTPSTKNTLASLRPRKAIFWREYFSANGLLRELISDSKGRGYTYSFASKRTDDARTSPKVRTASTAGLPQDRNLQSPAGYEPSPPGPAEYPHRRRKRLKQRQQEASVDQDLPPDASSRLSTLSSNLPIRSLRRRLAAYLSLSKPRLSFLIVLTTTASYAIYPMPSILLSSATSVPSLSPLILLFLTSGTALACSSANALNMLYEPDSDAKMSRTRNRPLVRGLVSRRGALVFAILAGTLGCGGLYYGVNPTVAALGFTNIVLYAGVYTPLKRLSVLNTWAGALVGAIPPLMGWTAAAGQCASSYRSVDGSIADPGWQELLFPQDGSSIGGWLLAALLFAWQFPHFNALSHTIKDEYKAAGLRMLAWVSPRANARIAFRYSLFMFPLCFGLSYYEITDWGFIATSGVVNTWMLVEAWRFWRRTGGQGSARGLFWASVWHLPIILVLAMAQKKGLWDRIWRGMLGDQGEDHIEEEDDGSSKDAWAIEDGTQSAEMVNTI